MLYSHNTGIKWFDLKVLSFRFSLSAVKILRWQKAQDSGAFKDEIVPIPVKGKKGPENFSVDEHPRGNATIQEMNKLPAVFKKG